MKCNQCGEEYDDERIIGYCSLHCLYKAYPGDNVVFRGIKECPVCGNRFNLLYDGQKYCSHKCRKRAVTPRVQTECAFCHKRMLVPETRKYCSRECRYKDSVKKYRDAHGTVEVERECPVCHKKFKTTRKNKVYCTPRCHFNRRKHGKEKEALVCAPDGASG